jgi:hypothetical protein
MKVVENPSTPKAVLRARTDDEHGLVSSKAQAKVEGDKNPEAYFWNHPWQW